MILTWRQGQASEPDANDSAAGRDGGNVRVQDVTGGMSPVTSISPPIHAPPEWGAD